MINHIKPLGAFIENTIRPLLDEVHWFFEECEKHHLIITETNLKRVAEFIVDCWLIGLIVKLIQNVIIALIIGFVICKIYQ